MATTGKTQTRTDFLQDLFAKNPALKEKDAAAAWTEAGYEGTISPSSFYNARKQFEGRSHTPESAAEKPKPKSSSKGSNGRRKSASVQPLSLESNGESSSPETVKTVRRSEEQDRSRRLDAVESGIDELIFTIKQMGGDPEVEEALRAARRLLYTR